MSYLVDTNVFSEQAKPTPDLKVIAWLRQHESELYVSTITIGEIRRGIERLPDGKRKSQLQQWLQSLCDCMRGRILGLTPAPPMFGVSSKRSGKNLESTSLPSTAR